MIKVLIVEDDPMVREITEDYINDIRGFSVMGKCENGLSALSFLEKTSVNLIIADINMPRLDGIGFIKKLRFIQNNSDVIFISGLNDSATLQSALKYGAVDYIVKPYNYERFQAAMRAYKKRYEIINSKDKISQFDIDSMLHRYQKDIQKDLPKGVHSATLKKITTYIDNQNGIFNINDISDNLKMSKVALRKYLDHLVEKEVIISDIEYGSVGRPKYTYRKNIL